MSPSTSSPQAPGSKPNPWGWLRAILFPHRSPGNAPQPDPVAQAVRAQARERRLRQVWTLGSILSIALNAVLLVVLLVLINQIFVLKKIVNNELLQGLYFNFVRMDEASIIATIEVNDVIPIDLILPIDQDTQMVLTQDTQLDNAIIKSLNTGGLVIQNAPADIILSANTVLPVRIKMDVPVTTTVPISLKVPVIIPMAETELHQPFVGLQQVVSGYYWMLRPEIQKCSDLPIFAWAGDLCSLFFSNPAP